MTLVSTTGQFQDALKAVVPGETIQLEPGVYENDGRWRLAHCSGTPERDTVVEGVDPNNRPQIVGGADMYAPKVGHFTLRDIILRGTEADGFQAGDAGERVPFGTLSPSHHITVERVLFDRCGVVKASGDAMKFVHTDHLTISDCEIVGWPGESAIDMVGCQWATIKRVVFRDSPNGGQPAIIFKGGGQFLRILGCRFSGIKAPSIMLGSTGTTGPGWREMPSRDGINWGARDVEIAGCTFDKLAGSRHTIALNASAYVGVHHNSFRATDEAVWSIWIKDADDPVFLPPHDTVFEANVIEFAGRAKDAVRAGEGNFDPTTTRFHRNAWFCATGLITDEEIGQLVPVQEIEGAYNVDPQFGPAMEITSTDPVFAGKGADAWDGEIAPFPGPEPDPLPIPDPIPAPGFVVPEGWEIDKIILRPKR